jgi:hypothetical protein
MVQAATVPVTYCVTMFTAGCTTTVYHSIGSYSEERDANTYQAEPTTCIAMHMETVNGIYTVLHSFT